MAEAKGGLPNFRGDLAWLHARESHAGRPYWPGGNSGVTLDPGLDLGHASVNLVERLIYPLLSVEQRRAVWQVLGLRGQKARQALKSSSILQSIRTSREQAASLLASIALPYWLAIVRRFPALQQAPPAVQTALLSLAYNRGPGNEGLAVLGPLLEAGDWRGVAQAIGNMQQDHPLAGIRNRRKLEEELILQSLIESGDTAGVQPATP